MTCATCRNPIETMTHEFSGGGERWTIEAPLRFKASPDFRSATEGYCSPECSLAAYEAGRHV